jgi:hypothetical protein
LKLTVRGYFFDRCMCARSTYATGVICSGVIGSGALRGTCPNNWSLSSASTWVCPPIVLTVNLSGSSAGGCEIVGERGASRPTDWESMCWFSVVSSSLLSSPLPGFPDCSPTLLLPKPPSSSKALRSSSSLSDAASSSLSETPCWRRSASIIAWGSSLLNR